MMGVLERKKKQHFPLAFYSASVEKLESWLFFASRSLYVLYMSVCLYVSTTTTPTQALAGLIRGLMRNGQQPSFCQAQPWQILLPLLMAAS